MFSEYINQTSISSKAMRFGTETEGDARIVYMRITGHVVDEVSSCMHDYIPNFASSPDGVIYNTDNTSDLVGCVEIKCTFFDFERFGCRTKREKQNRFHGQRFAWRPSKKWSCT
jgi:hypothetical protein